ncbi:MAG: type I polyketide synthase, partial [Bacteroidota bacterium]
KTTDGARPSDVAIIGMSCRLPGAKNIEEFWQNLLSGKDVSHLVTDADLEAEGVISQFPNFPISNHVRRTYALDDPYSFDASFFGFHPKEAEMLDPQHRQFLETAYEALENAGYNPFAFEGKIGVFGGVARNTYQLNNLLTNKDLLENSGGWYQEMLASDSSFSISRVAYKLNLRGPAVNVQTACSTGGVAIHLACQSLLAGDSEMVLVGGGRVQAPVFAGYQHIEGGPLSPDGYCRAFDADANGMVQGHGMAMLVLKKLDKAIADGDHIWAVIKSTAINNDGSEKTGITAPSSKGQAACIAQALEKSGLTADKISYVEAHGTGTFIGDPMEIQGLTEGFRISDFGFRQGTGKSEIRNPKSEIAIGSVKTNIGHLDAGACIAGIIKTTLSLHHEVLPPTLHWRTPNPSLPFGTNSPFFVNAAPLEWRRSGEARRAGVSSFGLGGTNAHIILEEAPVVSGRTHLSESLKLSERSALPQILPFSAKTEQALEQASANLTAFIEKNPTISLADAAFTLATGRQHFPKRAAFLAFPGKEKLELVAPQSPITNHKSPIVFLFPGGGAQYVNMARDLLYEANPTFRRHV